MISTDNSAGFLPGKQINLGLDLQGGSHLLLRVDIDAVRKERLENLSERIRREFRSKKIRFNALVVSDEAVSLQVRGRMISVLLSKYLEILVVTTALLMTERLTRSRFTDAGLKIMRTRTVDQSIEIIRRRLDPEGTKEPIIQRQGLDRILVQLPGVDDPEAVKRLLGRTAKLTFQLVDISMTAAEAKQRGRTPPGFSADGKRK